MSSDLEQEIQRKVRALPEAKQLDVLTLIEECLREAEADPSDKPPIWEIFEGLSKQVALEEWSKFPVDGAEQHDHYLYGASKRKNP